MTYEIKQISKRKENKARILALCEDDGRRK